MKLIKNKKTIFFLIIFAIFLIAILYMVNKKSFEPKRICFQENCFSLEIADTTEERAQGLMFRQELAGDKGMLFVFSKEGVYNFWMKNTLIPLDIIWIDKEQKIVFMKKDAQPCEPDFCERINPEKSAKYVLELNSGVAQTTGLKIGDKLLFEF